RVAVAAEVKLGAELAGVGVGVGAPPPPPPLSQAASNRAGSRTGRERMTRGSFAVANDAVDPSFRSLFGTAAHFPRRRRSRHSRHVRARKQPRLETGGSRRPCARPRLAIPAKASPAAEQPCR